MTVTISARSDARCSPAGQELKIGENCPNGPALNGIVLSCATKIAVSATCRLSNSAHWMRSRLRPRRARRLLHRSHERRWPRNCHCHHRGTDHHSSPDNDRCPKRHRGADHHGDADDHRPHNHTAGQHRRSPGARPANPGARHLRRRRNGPPTKPTHRAWFLGPGHRRRLRPHDPPGSHGLREVHGLRQPRRQARRTDRHGDLEY